MRRMSMRMNLISKPEVAKQLTEEDRKQQQEDDEKQMKIERRKRKKHLKQMIELAKVKQQLQELNQKAFDSKIKAIMNKKNKLLSTDEEKREFMTIFDQIYNDCHERTMKEMAIINKHMCTKIESFDELSINADTIVSDEVKKLHAISDKWKLKERIIAKQIEFMEKKVKDIGMTQQEFEKFDSMVPFDK